MDDSIINEHLPLAKKIARRKARNHTEYEELVSVANLAIVEAAHNISPDHPNPTGYIRRAIRNKMADYMADGIIGISFRSASRKPEARLKVHSIDHHGPARRSSAQQEVEVRDFLSRLSEQERQIVQLRMRGHTDSEIAELLSISWNVVYRVRQSLRKRYNSHERD